ncbi:MAG: hypothetical protein J1F38_11235, partial [Muribaculaceae bacterium]|nr:hypothetical protein [Muribaculaceae bacterium]
MKKLFTLFSLLCLFGIFGANAYTFTINYTGEGISSPVYQNVTVQKKTDSATGTVTSTVDVNSDNYEFNSDDAQFTLEFTCESGFYINSLTTNNASVKGTANDDNTVWTITVNPSASTINVTVSNQVGGGGGNVDTPYITATYNPEAAVKDVYVNNMNGSPLEVPTQITGLDEFKGDYISLFITLESDYSYNKANVTFTYTSGSEQITWNGEGSLVKTSGSTPDYIEVKNIPFKQSYYNKDSVIKVEFTNKEPDPIEVTFLIYPSPNGYQNVTLKVDDVEEPLKTMRYDVTVSDEAKTLVFEGKDGYYIQNYQIGSGNSYPGGLTFENNVLTVVVSEDVTENETIYITVAEKPAQSVAVSFDVENYPGLISSLKWQTDVQPTVIASDDDLEGYQISFTSQMSEGILTITFSQNPNNHEVYYNVTSVKAAVTTANGNQEIEGTVDDNSEQATLTIPSSAKSVAVSFVAEANEEAQPEIFSVIFDVEESIQDQITIEAANIDDFDWTSDDSFDVEEGTLFTITTPSYLDVNDDDAILVYVVAQNVTVDPETEPWNTYSESADTFTYQVKITDNCKIVVQTVATTGVNSIEKPFNGGEVIYNLQGQKVANPSNGIF